MIRSFKPAGDEQLAVLQEAQVAGAQEGPFAGVLQIGAERALGLLGALPVALRHARARRPRSRRPGRRAGGSAFSGSTITIRWSSRLPPQPTSSRTPSSSGQGVDHLVALQRLGVEGANHGRLPP